MMPVTVDSLAQDIEGLLAFQRALGYSYRRNEATLRSFQRFACRGLRQGARIDLAAVTEAWLARVPDRKPVTLACDLGAVRQLCRFRRRRDPKGYLPGTVLAPQTESRYAPHIFSTGEIRALIQAADRHQGRNFWPGLLRLLILTTYCTGLRFGETLRLRCADVDLHNCVLHIRMSKGRARLVPFGSDLAREFRRYWPQRLGILRAKGCGPDEALFIGRYGRAVTLKGASEAVRRLLRQLGLKARRGRIGPRPYDLRHAFAVHRLTAWYRDGVDIHARLPWLSAYMGHVNVLGTEVYLHATPQLLKIASDRFAKRVTG
ncbi:MAG: tyrosine-type recombinase/integrase [Terriglobales bacterium]